MRRYVPIPQVTEIRNILPRVYVQPYREAEIESARECESCGEWTTFRESYPPERFCLQCKARMIFEPSGKMHGA